MALAALAKLGTFASSSLGGGIIKLSLNRPKVNAINLAVLQDMVAAFDIVSAAPEVTGVLLASENPKCFSAGLDLAELYGYIASGNRAALENFAFTVMTPAFAGPSKCPKPVAAAVDGHAIAGVCDVCTW